jgi:tRNA-specific 2-thiouridylase
VRKIAEKQGLTTAGKKDSQGICFVGSVGIQDFLSEFVDSVPGDSIDQDTGVVVGRHSGAIFYTLGQRHGLELGGGMPHYVTGKDMSKNEVYVSRNLNNDAMWRKTVDLADIHWIREAPEEGEKIAVRMRHRGKLLPAQLQGTTLVMHEPERAVTAGQSAVIYRGDQVLGGGIVV